MLVDSFGREIRYLRLSITDRCDLRCSYCLPEQHSDFQEPDSWLNFDETERIVSAFAQLGVQRLRITGGEPLVRRNAEELISRLARVPGIEDLSLSTNATRLGKLAPTLAQAGVQRINVSLDTLDAEQFQRITKGKLQKVLDGLQAAKEAGLAPIKINMVLMQGENEDQVQPMIEYCAAQGFTLRLIETMPIGQPGQQATSSYVSLQTVRAQLEQRYTMSPTVMPGGGPARYWKIEQLGVKIGFITPISQHFCETCNRVRLTTDGVLHTCLGQSDQHPLKPLASGKDPEALLNAIREAIRLKPEKHEFREKPSQIVRFMASTGG